MMNFQDALEILLSPQNTQASRLSSRAVIQIPAKSQNQAERVVNYAELAQLIDRAAAAFQAASVSKHDPVVLCSPNTPELVAAILAVWKLGAVAIPVDYRMTVAEIDNIATRVKAKVVYAHKTLEITSPVITNNDWPQNASTSIAIAADADSPALVILTSGTTGIPKGAVHDLGSLINNIQELGEMAGFQPSDIALSPLPVSHILGLEVLLVCLLYGSTMCFADFIPADFAANIIAVKPTFLVGVPTIYGALTSLPVPPETLQSLRILLCGGAPLPESLADEFEKKFGKRITQGYGSTETKIITLNLDGPVTAVGKAVPSAQIDIVDENDNLLPDGQAGEIRIGGPVLMQGYLNQPEVTSKIMRNGYYHTGDIGFKENDRIHISGRSKEMIIVAGNKVFPSEVETVIRQFPLVSEVAVIGVAHRKLGQLVKAVVVLKPGDYSKNLEQDQPDRGSLQELESQFKELCKQNLKRELRPMDWDFRPASKPLPKTNTGKVDKKQLES